MIKEIRYWETSDGSQFDTEEEAEEYEIASMKGNDLILYDSSGSETNYLSNYDSVFYIDVKNGQGIKTLKKLADYWNINPCDLPQEIGLFQFNEIEEEWMNAKEWIENEMKKWAVQVNWENIFSSVKV